MFTVEINLTDACNFRCTYCFEGDSHKAVNFDKKLLPKFFSFVDSLLLKDTVNIVFWGGEPLLQFETLEEIVLRYKDNERATFLLYTNGSCTDKLIRLLKVGNSHRNKFYTQISYDGKQCNDGNRLDINHNKTSSKVIATAEELFKNGLNFVFKSTICPKDFKFLPQSYLEIQQFWETHKDDAKALIPESYFPTIQYIAPKRDKTQELVDLKEALILIGHLEIEFYKKYRRFFFKWFTPSKLLCSSGNNMLMVNCNGDVYKCHGTLYSKCANLHNIGNIEDTSILNKLEFSIQQHELYKTNEPDACKKCNATFCLRCNSMQFDYSSKADYYDRWVDLNSYNYNCDFYKTNGLVYRQLIQTLHRS